MELVSNDDNHQVDKMSFFSKIWTKIKRKWTKIRLQPIRVFCLHHVCEQFDADTMYPCDWMALDAFKKKINELRNQGYQFISLTEAYEHLKKDRFRYKKYAVLTFDDGYKSLLEVMPWLEEQQIPATLFINGKYLDGKSYRNNANEKYLMYDELFSLSSEVFTLPKCDINIILVTNIITNSQIATHRE